MRLSIEIPPTDEAWLQAQAKRYSVPPAEIIRKLIHEQAISVQSPVYRTAQQQILAMDSSAKANRSAPLLPDSAFDRESVYDDQL